MGIKEKLENNIIIVACGVAIASGSFTFGVTKYLNAQKTELLLQEHSIAIKKLEEKLGSIQRGIFDKSFLDVSKLQLMGEIHEGVPTDAKYFPADKFYAPRNSDDYEYSETTETDLLYRITGQEMPEKMKQMGTVVPLHLWAGRNVKKVEGSNIFKELFSFVSVERLTYEDLGRVLGLGISFKKDNDIKIEEDKSAQEYLSEFDKMFRGDAAGTFLTLQLFMQMRVSLMNPIEFRIVNIQKVHNVLYAQILIELKNVVVDGKNYERYFLRKELMVFSTPSDIFVVTTLIPSDDLSTRSPAFASVTKWLGSFRIVATT